GCLRFRRQPDARGPGDASSRGGPRLGLAQDGRLLRRGGGGGPLRRVREGPTRAQGPRAPEGRGPGLRGPRDLPPPRRAQGGARRAQDPRLPPLLFRSPGRLRPARRVGPPAGGNHHPL
ncbi:MAG: Cysteine synthase, partial [uncultured Rubrobacteraceae bacterium]